MPIRIGLKLILGFCLIYLATLNYLMVNLFWFPMVDRYEEKIFDQNSKDAEKYFRKVFTQTAAVATDYAQWELACTYIQSEEMWGKLPELESFDTEKLGVDFMAVVSADGVPIISKMSSGLPIQSEQLAPLLGAVVKKFSKDTDSLTGTLIDHSVPLFLAATPIQDGKDGVRCPGFVVAGNVLENISGELFHPDRVDPNGTEVPHADFQLAGAPSAVDTFSRNHANEYSSRQIEFASIAGLQPPVVLSLLMHHELLGLLQQVSRISDCIALAIWLSMAVLVYLFVNRYALNQIAQASRDARDLTRDENPLRELPSHPGRELGELISSFNTLLRSRREALSALVVNERQKGELFENALDAIVSIGADNKICAINRAAEMMLGYSRDELVGSDAIERLIPLQNQSRYRRIIERYFSGKKTFPFLDRLLEMNIRQVSGSEFPAEVSIVTTTGGPDEPRFTAFIRDITERRRFVERVIDSQKFEILGHLTGQLAHDFNNILGITLASIQIVAMEAELNEPCTARLVDAQEACWKGARLIKRLLTVARRNETQKEVFSLCGSVEEMMPLLRASVGEGIRINLAGSDVTGEVYVDRSGFESSLLNIVANARDAMEGTGEITITITTGRGEMGNSPGADYLVISVKDDGCGMDEKVVAKAFDPFFTTKPMGKGTGLGLAMVYAFAQENGGKASIYSKAGQGTTLRISLPKARLTNTLQPVAPDPKQVPKGQGQRILVVDDQEGIRTSVFEMLRKLGYHPSSAASAEEALDIIEYSQTTAGDLPSYDLVLSDVIMPGMGGSNLKIQMSRRWPSIPVIFMTGYSDGRLEEEGVELSDRILKPFGFKQLAVFVYSHFDKQVQPNIGPSR